jgi:hypothetical protein
MFLPEAGRAGAPRNHPEQCPPARKYIARGQGAWCGSQARTGSARTRAACRLSSDLMTAQCNCAVQPQLTAYYQLIRLRVNCVKLIMPD